MENAYLSVFSQRLDSSAQTNDQNREQCVTPGTALSNKSENIFEELFSKEQDNPDFDFD